MVHIASSCVSQQQSQQQMEPSAINFVFLSCHFPPRFRYFAKQMKLRGVTVLGVGDENYQNLHHELTDSLQEYYKVSNMENYEELYRCLGYFVHKYGRIHYVESFNEHWLENEAKLREDFNVYGGYRPLEMEMYKRKSGMKKVYQAAGLKCAPGMLPKTLEEAIEFANKTGYPLIMKPDIGVGASGATKINNEQELRNNWDGLGNSFMEKFVQGTIETYDGLCDHEGNIVFYSSLHYGGLMEVVNGSNESNSFYVTRDVPADLKAMGDIAVKAFLVKSRFFHAEFFRTTDGSLLPLEINLRPPGVITLDVVNFTYRTDLYAEFARVITKQPVTTYKPATQWGCYSARRDNWHYVHSNESVVSKLGSQLELTYDMPKIYSAVMGNFAYVFTSDSLDELKENVKFIESRVKSV